MENVIFDIIDNSVVSKQQKLLEDVLDCLKMIQTAQDEFQYQETRGMQVMTSLASFIKMICIKEVGDSLLAPLMTSQLVLLYKKPGLQPIIV